MDRRKIIWIIIVLIVLVGAFVGLTILSNVTGNAVTGASVNSLTIEQETFKINDNVNNEVVEDGSQNSG